MRYLVIGPSGAGKTAFCRAMSGLEEEKPLGPTQSVAFLGDYIDTPGVYLEHPRFYSALIICEQQADAVILMVGADQEGELLPPGLAQIFSRPVYGVVGKSDLSAAGAVQAACLLAWVGVSPPYSAVSLVRESGLEEWRCKTKEHERT